MHLKKKSSIVKCVLNCETDPEWVHLFALEPNLLRVKKNPSSPKSGMVEMQVGCRIAWLKRQELSSCMRSVQVHVRGRGGYDVGMLELCWMPLQLFL